MKNLFLLFLASAALAAFTVVAFFPPASIAALTLSLAASAAFAGLGSWAVPAAVLTAGFVAAASVYAIGGLVAGLFNLGSRIARSFTPAIATPTPEEVGFESTLEEEAKGSAAPLRRLGTPTPTDDNDPIISAPDQASEIAATIEDLTITATEQFADAEEDTTVGYSSNHPVTAI